MQPLPGHTHAPRCKPAPLHATASPPRSFSPRLPHNTQGPGPGCAPPGDRAVGSASRCPAGHPKSGPRDPPRGGCSQHAPCRVRAPPLPSGPFSSGHACLRPALPHGPCSRVRGSSARVWGSVRSRCLSGSVVVSSFVFFFASAAPEPAAPSPAPRCPVRKGRGGIFGNFLKTHD